MPGAASAPPEHVRQGSAPGGRALAQRLRTLILQVVPAASERAYPGWHGIGYRHPRAGYFAGIFPLAESVKLGFEWGVLLRDEDALLRSSPAGAKRVRYVELRLGDDVPEGALSVLLMEAIDLRS
jgi:hypothetical protein